MKTREPSRNNVSHKTYDAELTRLRLAGDWLGAEEYCTDVIKWCKTQLRPAANEQHTRLMAQALIDLSISQHVLEKHEAALKASKAAFQLSMKLSGTPVDDFFAYSLLARSHKAAGQYAEARAQIAKSIAAVLSETEAELVRSALLEVAAIHEAEGSRTIAEALSEMAENAKLKGPKARKRP
jgi:hypothetical protein